MDCSRRLIHLSKNRRDCVAALLQYIPEELYMVSGGREYNCLFVLLDSMSQKHEQGADLLLWPHLKKSNPTT